MDSDDLQDRSIENHINNNIKERNNTMNHSSKSEIPINDKNETSQSYNRTDKELYFKPSYRKRLF